MMIPYQSILTPLFVIGAKVNMLNSLVALSLVYILFQLPFSIFLMRNSFEAIPKEMEEAARMDGCGSLSTLWHVMLRLVRPGLITVALYAFINAWNEFLRRSCSLAVRTGFRYPSCSRPFDPGASDKSIGALCRQAQSCPLSHAFCCSCCCSAITLKD